MKTLIMISLLLCGAFLQAFLPVIRMLGYAAFPVLTGLVVFFGLTHSRGVALRFAFVAGILQDGLSFTPLGFSSFCFCVAVWFLHRFKEEVFLNDWVTHVLFGAAANMFVVLTMYGLLSQAESLQLPFSYFALKMLGALLLGGVVVPVIFYLVDHLYQKLGVDYLEVAV